MSEDLHRYLHSLVEQAIKTQGVSGNEIADRSGVSPALISQLRQPKMRIRPDGEPAGFQLTKLEQLADYFGIDLIDMFQNARAFAAGGTLAEDADVCPARAMAMSRIRGMLSNEAIERVLALPPNKDRSALEWAAIAIEEERAIARAAERKKLEDTATAQARIAGAKKLPPKSKKKAS